MVASRSRGLPVSKKQCCDIVGWTAWQFDQASKNGLPIAEHPTGRGTDYVVFMGDVIGWIVEQELKEAGHDPGDRPEKLDLNAERARLAKEQADKTKMENELARGVLVRAEEVAKHDEIVFTTIRDRVMGVASIAPLLRDAAVTDGVAGVRHTLREALAEALDKVVPTEDPDRKAA